MTKKAKDGSQRGGGGLLRGARVYLSGPMDFVASRAEEKKNGWRTRVGAVLRDFGAVVFDPWNKPEVRGLHGYGQEGIDTAAARAAWTFEDSPAGARTRAKLTGHYWETLHIDLRMVDTADFVIAHCPTNIYSVGTVHEIALCRLERKPVLFVSPPVEFPTYDALCKHLADDRVGKKLLERLRDELPIKPNERGIPSLWYMPLVGGEGFFDGFGFNFPQYRRRGWQETALDKRERRRRPIRPLLPFLEQLNRRLPEKWDNRLKRYVRNDDWLLWNIRKDGTIEEPHGER
ncbi:MAG TPA: hypothetical protein VK442_08255 [Xanthobacteraceae bacterium]|nr:hypothetical protein [Xanthobacteraceae bacterium]